MLEQSVSHAHIMSLELTLCILLAFSFQSTTEQCVDCNSRVCVARFDVCAGWIHFCIVFTLDNFKSVTVYYCSSVDYTVSQFVQVLACRKFATRRSIYRIKLLIEVPGLLFYDIRNKTKVMFFERGFVAWGFVVGVFCL